MARVVSEVKSHEGMSYLDVTSLGDGGEVLYTHQVWVDTDTSLHSLLLDHAWFLNKTTGHLACQVAHGPLREAFEEQGSVPAQFSLGRAIAALMSRGTGRKIRRVFAEPTDARAASVTIDYEPLNLPVLLPAEPVREVTAELLPNGYEPRAVSIAAQRRAIADQRRKEADDRRKLAERHAEAKFFARQSKEMERERARAAKLTGTDLAVLCKAQAEEMLKAALAAGEPWAHSSMRARAGHKPGKGEIVVQAPRVYQRLLSGRPLPISQAEAEGQHEHRYKKSQAAFEDYCALFPAGFSRAVLRTAWLKRYPEHDWVAWEDPTGSEHLDEAVRHELLHRQVAPETRLIVAPLPAVTDEEVEKIKQFWATGKFEKEGEV